MEEQRRHKGFVIGDSKSAHGQTLWKVRVKDPSSPYHLVKLTVVSIHGGITLARGLNVDFAIGSIDDPSGKKVLRAVDVRLV